MLKDFQITAYLPAKDLARAKKFYEEKIGLTPSATSEAGAMYPCGRGSRVFLYVSGFAGTNQASTAYWEVTDIEKEVAELQERGVTFEEYDFPGSKTENGIALQKNNKAAWFKDTEGNTLALIQPVG
jgi:predicted enzyme related to lactoylglutathione lyase